VTIPAIECSEWQHRYFLLFHVSNEVANEAEPTFENNDYFATYLNPLKQFNPPGRATF
jgi:hypothetical protein